MKYGVEASIPKLPGSVKAERSLEPLYSQLMLMSICNPYGLAKGEVVNAFEIMSELCSSVDISIMEEDESAVAGHFYINCLSDKPPTPSVLRKTEEQSYPPTLVLDTKPTLVKVDLLFQRSQMTKASSQASDLELIKKIAPYLNISFERKQFRTELEEKQKVTLAIGLQPVYRAIATRHSSPEITAQNLGKEWQVLNKNSSGYLVSRDKEQEKYQLRVGDLVGVFGETEKQALDLLQLGFIRWLKTDLHGTTKMGLVLIEGQPVSVELHCQNKDEPLQGLFMPEESRIHQTASLITDKKVFSRDGKIGIKPRRKKFQFEMTMQALLDTGKNFEHFSLSD